MHMHAIVTDDEGLTSMQGGVALVQRRLRMVPRKDERCRAHHSKLTGFITVD